jgi:hypothetical protein
MSGASITPRSLARSRSFCGGRRHQATNCALAHAAPPAAERVRPFSVQAGPVIMSASTHSRPAPPMKCVCSWRVIDGPRRREAAVVSRRDTRPASHTLPTGDARAQIDRVHNHSSRATTGPTPCRPGAAPQQRYEHKVKSRNNKAT